MKKILMRNLELCGLKYEKLPVIIDNDLNVLIVPLLWSLHLYNYGTSHHWRIKSNGEKSEDFIEESDINDNTISIYISHVFSFLQTINGSIDNQIAIIKEDSVNNYLNNVLPEKSISLPTLSLSLSALSSFFNFLHSLNLCPKIKPKIYRTTRHRVEVNNKLPLKIKYITRAIRLKLLQSCSNKRDRLILRMGFEVGLRAAENVGLVLEDIKVKNKPVRGLLSLFRELDENPSKLTFQYYLRGKYAKRGKGRFIYFARPLLEDLKNYYETERNLFGVPVCEQLFVRADNSHKMESISREHATRIFRNLIRSIHPKLQDKYTYHDLRHTFATELYHSELLDENGLETRSESAALYTVSQRLGHSDTDTTTVYIRLQHQMQILEYSG